MMFNFTISSNVLLSLFLIFFYLRTPQGVAIPSQTAPIEQCLNNTDLIKYSCDFDTNLCLWKNSPGPVNVKSGEEPLRWKRKPHENFGGESVIFSESGKFASFDVTNAKVPLHAKARLQLRIDSTLISSSSSSPSTAITNETTLHDIQTTMKTTKTTEEETTTIPISIKTATTREEKDEKLYSTQTQYLPGLCLSFAFASTSYNGLTPILRILTRPKYDLESEMVDMYNISRDTMGQWEIYNIHFCVNSDPLIIFESEKISPGALVGIDDIKISTSTLKCPPIDFNTGTTSTDTNTNTNTHNTTNISISTQQTSTETTTFSSSTSTVPLVTAPKTTHNNTTSTTSTSNAIFTSTAAPKTTNNNTTTTNNANISTSMVAPNSTIAINTYAITTATTTSSSQAHNGTITNSSSTTSSSTFSQLPNTTTTMRTNNTRGMTSSTSFPPNSNQSKSSSKLSKGVIAGIILASILGVGFASFLVWFLVKRLRNGGEKSYVLNDGNYKHFDMNVIKNDRADWPSE